ncbi:hypothetical protein NM688_g1464 [Phlebia brevispora]|uniref:Uncharacterized protein n=1 Tax=Phlebia brevispora TaxID=194682 RepID=A0ACC1TBQ9_9APHY|nr:hypothetical protein NM688_g1464 [Phlebia brevispora]
MSNLESFVKPAKPFPHPVCTSQEITDRNSIFVANIFRATTHDEVRKAVTHLRNVIHASKPASHEMYAWRCMVLRHGRSGLGGPDDFELKMGNEDDGEKYGSGHILKVMQAEGIIDAVVVVSRWYGGEMLGPVRFEHIENCAREVCHAFRIGDELEEQVATLRTLDDLLSMLRDELAELTGAKQKAAGGAKKHDYQALLDTQDLAKAKRLVTARENSIRSVKTSLSKAKDRTEEKTTDDEAPKLQ